MTEATIEKPKKKNKATSTKLSAEDVAVVLEQIKNNPDIMAELSRKTNAPKKNRKSADPSAYVSAHGSVVHPENFKIYPPEGVSRKGPEAVRIWEDRQAEGRSTSNRRIGALMDTNEVASMVREEKSNVDMSDSNWHEQ
jgi:hypothetical protein|tara:strand:- start:3772 stop:4188 length:417 start_codon:yes stop_codon:yes gene_type:complete